MTLPSPFDSRHDEIIDLPNNPYAVIDGDTLYNRNTGEKLRLSAINANEVRHAAKPGSYTQVSGREASGMLADYLGKAGVDVTPRGTDKYGRTIGGVNNDAASEYMVRNLAALPTYYGSEPPELKHRLDVARDMALQDYRYGASNPAMDATRSTPIDPNRGIKAVEPPRPKPNGLIVDSLQRGVDVLQGDLFGAGHALARAVDKVPGFEGKNANTLRIMEEGVKRNEEEAALNPAKYGSYKDVKGVGDVLPFMAEKAIESLPSMAPMAVGGLMGVGAKTVLGALSSGVAKKTAATIGATALGAVPHAGEIEQEQMKLKDPAPAWQVAGGALINSALDTFGVVKGLDQFLGASKAKGVLDVAKQLAQSLGVTSVTEGATEGLQQLTNIALRSMHDPDYNPLTNPKDRASAVQELAEAGIGGAAAGGLMGGLGRASGMVTESMKSDSGADQTSNDANPVIPPNPTQPGQELQNEQMAVGSNLGPVGMEPPAPTSVAEADTASVMADIQPTEVSAPTADSGAIVSEIQNEALSTAPIVSTDSVQELAPDAADNGVGEEDVDTAPDKPFGELFGSHPLVINQRDKDGGRLSRVINKDIEKAERANKFIGFGSPGSSTDVYRQAAESLGAANTGDYTEDDQVFVSVNGNRNGAIAVTDPRYQAELDSAARAGVMFVTDTKEYTDGSRFNTGEKALRIELGDRGYVDQGNGEWIPGNSWREWVNSLSVTSTPDAAGNLGNVTERDGSALADTSRAVTAEPGSPDTFTVAVNNIITNLNAMMSAREHPDAIDRPLKSTLLKLGFRWGSADLHKSDLNRLDYALRTVEAYKINFGKNKNAPDTGSNLPPSPSNITPAISPSNTSTDIQMGSGVGAKSFPSLYPDIEKFNTSIKEFVSTKGGLSEGLIRKLFDFPMWVAFGEVSPQKAHAVYGLVNDALSGKPVKRSDLVAALTGDDQAYKDATAEAEALGISPYEVFMRRSSTTPNQQGGITNAGPSVWDSITFTDDLADIPEWYGKPDVLIPENTPKRVRHESVRHLNDNELARILPSLNAIYAEHPELKSVPVLMWDDNVDEGPLDSAKRKTGIGVMTKRGVGGKPDGVYLNSKLFTPDAGGIHADKLTKSREKLWEAVLAHELGHATEFTYPDAAKHVNLKSLEAVFISAQAIFKEGSLLSLLVKHPFFDQYTTQSVREHELIADSFAILHVTRNSSNAKVQKFRAELEQHLGDLRGAIDGGRLVSTDSVPGNGAGIQPAQSGPQPVVTGTRGRTNDNMGSVPDGTGSEGGRARGLASDPQKSNQQGPIVDGQIVRGQAPAAENSATTPATGKQSGKSAFSLVKLPFNATENRLNDAKAIDGHRYGGKNINNAEPGERGWLGNPYKAEDAGGSLSREEAVARYKKDLYARAARDTGFAAALQGLRGKTIAYYKPDEKFIHLHAIQEWLNEHPAENSATKVETAKRYTRKEIQDNKDSKVYVFGDNMVGKGRGGQAAETRGEPNTIGIPTKYYPAMDIEAFFGKDSKREKEAITAAVDKVIAAMDQGKIVVLPEDGIGTGRAKLQEKAPDVYVHLQEQLERIKQHGVGGSKQEASKQSSKPKVNIANAPRATTPLELPADRTYPSNEDRDASELASISRSADDRIYDGKPDASDLAAIFAADPDLEFEAFIDELNAPNESVAAKRTKLAKMIQAIQNNPHQVDALAIRLAESLSEFPTETDLNPSSYKHTRSYKDADASVLTPLGGEQLSSPQVKPTDNWVLQRRNQQLSLARAALTSLKAINSASKAIRLLESKIAALNASDNAGVQLLNALDFSEVAPMMGTGTDYEAVRASDYTNEDGETLEQNARGVDPERTDKVIYHGAYGASSNDISKVNGWSAGSNAIFGHLKKLSGLPHVIADGYGVYVAGEEDQTAAEARKADKYFELRLEGDFWRIHEINKSDTGDSLPASEIYRRVYDAISNVRSDLKNDKKGTSPKAKLAIKRMTPVDGKSNTFIDAPNLTRLGSMLNRREFGKTLTLPELLDDFSEAVTIMYDESVFGSNGFTVDTIPLDLVIAYQSVTVNGVKTTHAVTFKEAAAAARVSGFEQNVGGDYAYGLFDGYAVDEDSGAEYSTSTEKEAYESGKRKISRAAEIAEHDKMRAAEPKVSPTTTPTQRIFESTGKSYVADSRVDGFLRDIANKLGIKTRFHVVDESGLVGLMARLNAISAHIKVEIDLLAVPAVLEEVEHMRDVLKHAIDPDDPGKGWAYFMGVVNENAERLQRGIQELAEKLKFVEAKDFRSKESAERIENILNEFKKNYEKKPAELRARRDALRATMNTLKDTKSSRIIYNDTSPVATDREPIIFLANLKANGDAKSFARQINEAIHEFGHLIKRVAVDQLIAKANKGDTESKMVVDALFSNVDWNNESEAILADERFARMTQKWGLTHAVPKNAIERFFKGIGDKLRRLYNAAKAMFTKPEDRKQFESFERFMEAMMDRAGVVTATEERAGLYKANTLVDPNYNPRDVMAKKTYADFVNSLVLSEFAPQNKKGATFHNYTPEESMQAVQKYAKRAATWSKDKPVLGTVTKTLGGIADIMKLVAPHVRAVVPVMQDIAPHWGEIGGHWVTLPGTKPLTKMWRVRIENGKITKESRDFVPIHIEIGKIRNGILKDNKSLVEIMSDVLAALPKVEGLAWMKSAQRKQVAERYEGMARDLLKFTTNQIPYSALSEEAKAVADYFKLLNDVFARSSEYSVTFNKRDAYFPLRIDKDKWNQNSRPVIEALIKYGKYPVEAAEHLFNEIARSHGIVDESLVDEAILASGLTAKHGRKFPLELQKALLDLDVYSMDIHHIVQGYTHQIIKRAVEQSRFGDYKRDTKGTYIKDDNGHFIFDPMGQINHIMDVDRATYYQNNSKGVHPEKLDWLRTKAFPALRGTLGGTIDPKLNALMDWTMLALNFIMLPLSVTSQLPDLAGIANMRGRTLLQPREMLRDVIKVARYFTDKSERESLRRAAQVIGSIEPHLVSSILAESMADEYMTPSTKRLSEAFFEATQMKRFTDFSRVLSTRFAIDALNEYADKPTAAKTLKLLQELHLSPQALAAWDRAGRPTDVNSLMQHDQIRTALAQWNDMAILRPSAGMRPVIGSDVRAKLFWHLKNYLYAFYYMQMKRAWVNMKDESNFAAAVPAISLGAFAMGLALAGYELRKLLANEIIPELVGVDGKSKDEDAGDLVWESFDRSGLMGPFSIIHDMWSAEKRGQMAISSLMGPAFSKTVDFMDKDLPDFLAANIPVVAQSAPLRSAARRELGKYLPDQLIGED